MQFDPSQDYQVWDCTETIMYLSKTGQVVPSGGVPVAGTLWMAIKKTNLAPDSALLDMDLSVNLPGANMAGIVPKNWDILVRADASQWVVKITDIVMIGNEYRVYVKRVPGT